MFAAIDLDGPEAQALYAIAARAAPVARRDARRLRAPRGPAGRKARQPRLAPVHGGRLREDEAADAARCRSEGARVVVGGHTEVPFAARGEAPWRELELLVESGFTPLEAITAATSTAAGFLYRDKELGTLRAGLQADLVVLARATRAATSPRSGRSSA